MTIGDDIFTILGMMPIRDRAGIQRATMADEAVKASAGPNAEGQQLTQQGQRPPPMGAPPPDVQLPDGIGTAYASGRAGKAPSMTLPPPVERTIAASPAASPSPEVARGSDMILAEMERRKQAENMNGVFASLGLLANALNRGGSADSTRTALAGEAFGGGSKGASVAEMIALSKLRGEENAAVNEAQARAKMVDQAQRMFGLSKQDAEARAATGELQKLFDPATIAKREEDSRAQRTRMDLAKPEVVAEIAKRTGMPPAVVEADIRSGKIGQKEISDILHTQAQTGKLGAETAETLQKTEEARKAALSFEDAKKDPVEFAKRYPQLDTPAKVAAALANRPTYDEFTKNALSNATPHLKEWEQDELRRKQLQLPSRSLPEFVAAMQPKHIESPEEKGEAASVTHIAKGLSDEHTRVSAIDRKLRTWDPIAQSLYDEKQLGGTKFSQMALGLRKTLGQMVLPEGQYDEKVVQSETFFNTIGENVLRRAKEFPGALSNDDRIFLQQLSGTMEMSPRSIRELMLIGEKMARAEMRHFNENLDKSKTSKSAGRRGAAAPYDRFEAPPPGRFLQEEFDRRGGAAILADAQARGKIADPGFVEKFEEKFGKDTLPYYLQRGG